MSVRVCPFDLEKSQMYLIFNVNGNGDETQVNA